MSAAPSPGKGTAIITALPEFTVTADIDSVLDHIPVLFHSVIPGKNVGKGLSQNFAGNAFATKDARQDGTIIRNSDLALPAGIELRGLCKFLAV